MAYQSNKSGYGVPVAVIMAGFIIAGAVFLSGGSSSNNSGSGGGSGNTVRYVESRGFRIPDGSDHIRGNLSASISVVEFSDFECPFCARLHPTLARIVKENNDVKWIYRHFPLSSIHSRALSAARASECIARLGGNDNFWEFTDAAFQNQRRLGNSWYRGMAASFGIGSEEFENCMDDKSIAQDVKNDLNEATKSGGRGTPFVVVVSPSGRITTFSGALPYDSIANIIQEARNN